MNGTLLGIVAYVFAQLALGLYVSRRIRTEDDYLLAGRSLGLGLGTFTIFATWFGAETCIGAAGALYQDGLSGGTADPFGYGLCLLVMGLVFAVPLWRRRLTTLGDLFRLRFSPGAERMAVLLMIPTSLLWAAAQVRAFGQVLSAVSGFDATLTITVAALVVVAYTATGGLLADAWTDLVQGITLIVGLLVLLGYVLFDAGPATTDVLSARRLQLVPDGRSWLGVVEDWAIPVCGSVLAAELVARVIAIRTPGLARRASLLAAGVYLLVGLVPVTIGLVGPAYLPGLEHPEQILPLMAERLLPGVLYAIFSGALIAAILSTVDSALLVAGSLVSHNLAVPLLGVTDEARKVRLARTAVVFFGVVAYVLALHAEGVYALVEEASAFGSAGLFVTIVFGLFSSYGDERSAIAALVAGLVAWVAAAYLFAVPYPYLTSLAAAFVAYLLPSLLAQASGRAAYAESRLGP